MVLLINDSISTGQSVGTGLFKDPCLMGVFALPADDLSTVAPIHLISLGGPIAPRRVPSLLSFLFPVPQDPIPLLSSSLGKYLMTSNHKIRRTKRKGGRCKKRMPPQKSLAFGHHIGHHPPSASTNHARGKAPSAFVDHVGGKAPNSNHYDGNKLANSHLTGT